MRKILTQSKLKELLIYNPDTGLFTNKLLRNNKNAKEGGVSGYTDKEGYVLISILGTQHRAHRLAFLYMKGYLPENEVDHPNRIRNDNRWCNLREVSRQCNARNLKLNKLNTSGVSGISFQKNRDKWRAYINVKNKFIHIGVYGIFNDAVIARWKAEVKYEFPNCNTTSSAYEYLKKHNLLDKE